MELLDPKTDDYVAAHTQPEPAVLQELSRETWLKTLNPRMLSGHLQGRVLSMFSNMIKPVKVLEIGTFTGYSAICIAEGLPEGGKIITIDINEELEEMAHRYFEKSGISGKVDQRIGNAIDIIPGIDETFDLVFIDADKTNYSNYYDLVFDKLKTGGYIIADNMLWSGKVLEEYEQLDPDTKAIVDFSNKVQSDSRVQNVLFPIRDGLMVVRKV